jgi:hypothetical protein
MVTKDVKFIRDLNDLFFPVFSMSKLREIQLIVKKNTGSPVLTKLILLVLSLFC